MPPKKNAVGFGLVGGFFLVFFGGELCFNIGYLRGNVEISSTLWGEGSYKPEYLSQTNRQPFINSSFVEWGSEIM